MAFEAVLASDSNNRCHCIEQAPDARGGNNIDAAVKHINYSGLRHCSAL